MSDCLVSTSPYDSSRNFLAVKTVNNGIFEYPGGKSASTNDKRARLNSNIPYFLCDSRTKFWFNFNQFKIRLVIQLHA